MKIAKIISDGTSLGTNVYLEDGSTIDNISHIVWSINAQDKLAIVGLSINAHEIEVIVKGELIE